MVENADRLEREADAQECYENGVHRLDRALLTIKPSVKREHLETAAGYFRQAGDYKDAAALEKKCRELSDDTVTEESRMRLASIRRRMEDPAGCDYDSLIRQLEEQAWEDECREQASDLVERCRILSGKVRRKRMTRRSIWIGMAVLLAAGVIWSLTSGYVNYIKGFVYQHAGMESYALASYKKLGSRFGAEDKYVQCELEALSEALAADTVTFGAFQWRVLEKNAKEKTILLIASETGEGIPLSAVAFDSEADEKKEVSWETSTLRSWMNGELLAGSFSEQERAQIIPLARSASENKTYGTAYTRETEDCLAVPSAQELEKYKDAAGSGGDCWLRTPGHDVSCAAFVTGENVVRDYGMPADTLLAVRPVMLVSFA